MLFKKCIYKRITTYLKEKSVICKKSFAKLKSEVFVMPI